MSKLFMFMGSLIVIFMFEIFYLSMQKTNTDMIKNKKNDFISLVGLPDLAISTEATYIRHRSMSSVFSIYKDDGSLREYFPSTYVYSHSHIINRAFDE